MNTKKYTLVSCKKLTYLVPRTLLNFLVPHRKLGKGLGTMLSVKVDTVYKMAIFKGIFYQWYPLKGVPHVSISSGGVNQVTMGH